ncbi:MAG: DNA gyrase subunit A, partial [Proteobacteria bacterium]|nr:DNA gyrase subunit A [Pseudomonadota bacterium]
MDDTGKELIEATQIEQEMHEAFLSYAMSVIVSRALPDVRDGLKPVHRRILYAMSELKVFHNRPYLKSARIVGDVLGKYHPHGDSSVYDALVRMAQDFSMRYPAIDGQGNFGSLDGDSAAAMRYTESRMQEYAEYLLFDIDKGTVDFVPNYDNKEQEPVVLPTRIPHLLVNGASGIAVGMATQILPHNLGEVISALKALIHKPNITLSELMEYIPGPDFPGGGEIYGAENIRRGYQTGRGSVFVRCKTEIEEISSGPSSGKSRIVVTEIPYMLNKARLVEKIATLVNDKKVQGVSDIRDESSKQGIRVVIECKRGW